MHANTYSPAYQLLMKVAERRTQKKVALAAAKEEAKASLLPALTASNCTSAAAMAAPRQCERFCWSEDQIVGLIRWLQTQRYRYVYSDWESEFVSPKRQWVRSQHGRFVGYQVMGSPQRFQCGVNGAEGDDRPGRLCLSVGVERRQATPSSAYDPNEYRRATVQQRRMYQCGDHVRLHMATKFGRWYRVWMEIDIMHMQTADAESNTAWLCEEIAEYFRRTCDPPSSSKNKDNAGKMGKRRHHSSDAPLLPRQRV